MSDKDRYAERWDREPSERSELATRFSPRVLTDYPSCMDSARSTEWDAIRRTSSAPNRRSPGLRFCGRRGRFESSYPLAGNARPLGRFALGRCPPGYPAAAVLVIVRFATTADAPI